MSIIFSQKFFMPKNSLYLQISILFSIVWRRGKGIEFLLNFGTNNLIIVNAFGSTVVFVRFKVPIKMFLLTIWFRYVKKMSCFFLFFRGSNFCQSLLENFVSNNDRFHLIIIDLFFTSFLVDFLIEACLSTVEQKSRKNVSKPKFISFFVATFQQSSCISLMKRSVWKYLQSLQLVFIISVVTLFPLKFSTIMIWGSWSEIEVVILPERYLKDGLFTKMLPISVAVFSVTLVENLTCGVKLRSKSCSRKFYVSLFYYNL